MKILVYEYFSGGGTGHISDTDNLCSLGWAMLEACIEDCLNAGHQVHALIERQLQERLPAACAAEIVTRGQYLSAFKEMLTDVDAVLPIAPETDGTLSNLTSLVEGSGKLLLGSTTEATRVAGDKLASLLSLSSHGCKVPATALWPVPAEELKTPGPWILKPRSGAGSVGVRLTASPYELPIPHGEYLIQEYVPGTAASVSMIVGRRETVVLSANHQDMVFDPAARYKGGAIPLVHPLSKQAMACATLIPMAIPGLRGYVGVDMVLTQDEIYVIEVNPRITLAYCGLRRIASRNLMEMIIHAALGLDLQSNIHMVGAIKFDDFGKTLEQTDT